MNIAKTNFSFSDLLAIENNGGATLRHGKAVTYKSGWQVADHGVAYDNALAAYGAIIRMNGDCGIWLENGIYYIDHSFRVNTKREAIAIGREYNQISVLGWKKMNLAYC